MSLGRKSTSPMSAVARKYHVIRHSTSLQLLFATHGHCIRITRGPAQVWHSWPLYQKHPLPSASLPLMATVSETAVAQRKFATHGHCIRNTRGPAQVYHSGPLYQKHPWQSASLHWKYICEVLRNLWRSTRVNNKLFTLLGIVFYLTYVVILF